MAPATGGLRVGFKTAPIRIAWSALVDTWRAAGDLACFDSAWVYDHFYPNDGDGSCFEAFVTLTALAPLVPDCAVGPLVLANPYRHPALVAKMSATLDHVTGGRLVLGLGAGWHVVETTALGMDLDPVDARLAALRSAILVIRALMSAEAGIWDSAPAAAGGGVSLDVPPYRLRQARNDPLPIQGASLPIWLGVQGERIGLPIAGELADGWNFSGVGTLDDFSRRRDVVRRSAEAAGRDPAEIEISAQIKVDPQQPAAALAACRAFADSGCDHVILYVDPRVGPGGLASLAREVVFPLRETPLPSP